MASFDGSRFTTRARKVLNLAKDIAVANKASAIDPIHILCAIWGEGTGLACNSLKNLGIQEQQFKEMMEIALGQQSVEAPEGVESSKFPFTIATKRLLGLATEEAVELGHNVVGTEHLLLGILHDTESEACKVLNALGITLIRIQEEIKSLTGEKSQDPAQFKDNPGKVVDPKIKKKLTGRETPHIDKYSIDLTEMARTNKLSPCIGRHMERQRILQILGRKKKNNPVLIGEAGIGKTAIVEGIALDIVSGNAPESFRNKRVISIDLPGMIAGTKYRGQFEERIKGLMKEVIDSGDIIMFLDELHTLVGAGGSEGGMDASNILKPALARGELQCIGATTLDEYRKHIEKDGALERRFQAIIVEPPSTEQTLEILRGLQPEYEAHHNVKYTDAALRGAVNLSEKYISGRFFPDKAIDVIDEAGSKVKMSTSFKPEGIQAKEHQLETLKGTMEELVRTQEFEKAAGLRDEYKALKVDIQESIEQWKTDTIEKIDERVIASVVAGMTGIPVSQVSEEEKTRLLHIEEELHKHIVSQNEAIDCVAQAIRRSRAGLKNPRRPSGCFLFVGPTGVGKTLLCKQLAKFLFGSEEALIQIDMSEYMEKHNASRLVGAPPGYVGYEEGGQLTEKVRRRPYSVVLLDEIEKAHSDIFNMLLQIMEEGHITDSFGRKINFKNTILIMTSNLGSNLLQNTTGLGFSSSKVDHDHEATKKTLMEEIERTFRPEFINRLDDMVVFRSLSKEDIRSIVDIEFLDLQNKLKQQGFSVELTDAAKDLLMEQGYSEVFGARPLRRVIEKKIENPLSEMMLKNEFKDKKAIKILTDPEEDKFVFEAT